MEQHLRASGIAYADGFGPSDGDVRWADDDTYDDTASKVRLYKLHGSVDWYRLERDGLWQTAQWVGDDIGDVCDGAGKSLTVSRPRPSFLSGVNKSVSYHQGFFADVHHRFAGLQRSCHRMVMCGYGWGDTAINLQLEGRLDRKAANRLVLLHPNVSELIESEGAISTSRMSPTRTGPELHPSRPVPAGASGIEADGDRSRSRQSTSPSAPAAGGHDRRPAS